LPLVVATAVVATATTAGPAVAPVAAAGGDGPRCDRPFRADSYWNTPLGAHAPKDSHSRQWIRDSRDKSHTQNYLKLTDGDWAIPHYTSHASDPLYRVSANGKTVRVHIPRRAEAMPTADGQLVVTDRARGQVVSLHQAAFDGNRWTASSVSRYGTGTRGIAHGLPTGSRRNFGHRGIPGSVQAVLGREIRCGAIRHRLEVYWWETASQTPEGGEAYFPMTGSEDGKNGVVPEGAVIRIRPSVDLSERKLSPAAYIVARALQRYGAVVGDNSGSGNRMKLQANTDWSGVLGERALRDLKWRDYVFVKGGYRPQ
jgi:hypothetical protein